MTSEDEVWLVEHSLDGGKTWSPFQPAGWRKTEYAAGKYAKAQQDRDAMFVSHPGIYRAARYKLAQRHSGKEGGKQ